MSRTPYTSNKVRFIKTTIESRKILIGLVRKSINSFDSNGAQKILISSEITKIFIDNFNYYSSHRFTQDLISLWIIDKIFILCNIWELKLLSMVLLLLPAFHIKYYRLYDDPFLFFVYNNIDNELSNWSLNINPYFYFMIQ